MPKIQDFPIRADYIDWSTSGNVQDNLGYSQNAEKFMIEYYTNILKMNVKNKDFAGKYFRKKGKVTSAFLKDYASEIGKMSQEAQNSIKNDLHYFNICKDHADKELVGSYDLVVPPCPPFCNTGV